MITQPDFTYLEPRKFAELWLIRCTDELGDEADIAYRTEAAAWDAYRQLTRKTNEPVSASA